MATKTSKATKTQVLHSFKALGTLPEYSIDVSSTVNALLQPFAVEMAAADTARAHRDEAHSLMAQVKDINTRVSTMRLDKGACEKEAQRLLSIINAAEGAINTAFEQNTQYRQSKLWMREHNRSEEFEAAVVVQKEALLLEAVSKEMADRQASLDEMQHIQLEILKLCAQADEAAEAARKSFALADQILVEAGFKLPAKK